MAESDKNHPTVQDSLQQVVELLRRHQLVKGLVERQAMPRHELVESLVQKQNIAELQNKLEQLHPADVAYVLEALPLDERLAVWDLVKADRDGEILLEVSDAVRETLIAHMETKELVAATEQLDTDEIADLAPDLPREVMQDVFRSLSVEERDQLRAAMSYPEDTVGGIMDFDMITVRDDITVEVVLRYLRRLDEMPDHTDQIFVVDRQEHLRGLLSVSRLLVSDLDTRVTSIMTVATVKLAPNENAQDAATAFERYDLVSAPVVDGADKLIGRVTVNSVVDVIREETDSEKLSAGGLREEEDLFASVWSSVKNRWTWLAINLVTAFIASRVIGIFEDSIEKIVALAALMPIIAGIGGNSGNQTMTLIIRAIALNRISSGSLRTLIVKELSVSLTIGLLGGFVAGGFAYAISGRIALWPVMACAMILNMLVGATVGMVVPILRDRFGKDPAIGSSVLLTFATDTLGFFIFLGLATIFLV